MRTEWTVPAGRAALAAEAEGRGALVIGLHAGVCDRRMWRPLAEILKASCRLVAYDRRGFGETPAVDERRSQVDDLWAVMGHPAAGSPAILLGCSQGARIAIDAALQRPERVKALVLVAPAVSGAPPPELPESVQALVDAADEAEKTGEVVRLNALQAHLWLDGPLSAEGRVGGPLRQLFLTMNRIALNAPPLPSMSEPPSAWERLSDIRAPVLVLWGDLDFPHIKARCERLVEMLPRARAQLIKGTAHLPTLEQPEPCAAAIHAFIEEVGPISRADHRN